LDSTRIILKLSILLVGIACYISVQGQTAEQELKKREQILQDHIKKSNASLPPTGVIPPPSISNGVISQAELNRQKEILQRAEAELKAQRSPNPADSDKYKDFLQQKNTGLFKLFPDFHCGSQFVVKVDGNCEKTVQDSYSYSIQKRVYADGVFHDIRLEENRLWLDGFLSQSLITELGNIPLESVSLQNNYAEFLTNFKPSETNSEARKQFWEIAEKIKFNDFIYGKVVKLNLDATYLARIINYRIDDNQLIRNRPKDGESKEMKPFWVMSVDTKRADIIVAFRIVRIDNDNSVTILWKQFKERNSPKLRFAKNEKWIDLKAK
jgi:hypothetical protein